MRELTFLDLIVVERVDKDSVVERFGGKINSSFFDAANLLGTLKIKGYIDIESAIGFSPIRITEKGTNLLKMAQERIPDPLDEVDNGILSVMATGVSDVETLGRELNLRESDLAFHLYKLVKQNLIDYNLRAGKVSVIMTELGFKKAGGKKAKIVTPAEKDAEEDISREFIEESSGPARPAGRVVSDRWVRIGSKIKYYAKTWALYGVILLLILIIAVLFLINNVLKR
ncbi:hypothetical protein HY570_01415 [Candidatus Micrarchaeota archaeon]|nr:hypothetical protein [Candidatus Micrarchaeota archaeon]